MPQGFILVGGQGLLCVYEKGENKKDLFMEISRIRVGFTSLHYAAQLINKVKDIHTDHVSFELNVKIILIFDIGSSSCDDSDIPHTPRASQHWRNPH